MAKDPNKKVRRPNRFLLVLMCLISVVVIALNVAVVGVVAPHLDILQVFTSRPDMEAASLQEASAATASITEEVEAEGLILLTNDGVLPLAGVDKVNVFGSTTGNNFSYGGTGSGSGDSSKNVTFYQGLENAGLVPNPDLVSFYEENALSSADMGLVGTDWNLYELPQSAYSKELIDSATDYSDVAIVVITRKGGEGFDLPLDMADYSGSEAGRSYLELTPNEEDLIAMAKENFSTVIAVINSPNAMELGFLEDGIDAALWVGTPGSTGCNAIGNALVGAVNPSGRTVDTFPYEVESAPSYYNFGSYDYSNIGYVNGAMFAGTGDAAAGEDPYHYVEYVEGIYVGYRYYETAAADGFIDYDTTVQFPFGYGLSYTTFDETLDSVTLSGDVVTATVTVTNSGDVAGKQVVEIYCTAPYTLGGIEKSEVVLVGFDKTRLLEPGESQTVTIEFSRDDMASYDYTGVKAEGGAYVLEQGDYEISLRTDSHTVVDSKTISISRDYIFNDANDGARSGDLTTASNQFDDVSFGDGLVYVSRADWAGTMPTERSASTKEATPEQLEALTNPQLIDMGDVDDITTGAHNGLVLADMSGLDYDDPQWDALLDQVTLGEMKILVGNAGWLTASVDSVDKPAFVECDGPNGVNNIMVGVTGTQLTGQSVLGMTWNRELAERVGELFAKEAKEYGITGLYAPGANTHRSPFAGRNYEYVSEDGTLTGQIVAAEIRGMRSNGVYAYLKHFALNDQETHRGDGGLLTWANEQAMREIYLRAFEIAVKEGGSTGMMSSYNRIGTTPTAESYALLTTVLRNEWGFRGAVITDCTMAADTSDINRSLRAGNDLNLNFFQDFRMTADTTGTAAGHQALRNATHNVLYMIANSDALNVSSGSGLVGTLKTGLAAVDIVVIALIALYFWRRHRKMNLWRAQQEQLAA